MIAQWLTAGVIENGRFAPTGEGTPQGGIISPLLMNVALHGMETAAGVRYRHAPSVRGMTEAGSPVVVRYADDLVALCVSREQAEQVKARLAEWLAPRGLAFNEDKTRVVHLDDGFDFLGFNVRRYQAKLLIKPSKAAVKRHRERLTVEVKALRGANAAAVIKRLNPIIRGWSAYYRGVVSSEVFASLDKHVWRLTYRWATWSHPKKPKRWVINRYFGPFNRSRQDRWVFGNRESGAYLVKHAWTRVVRHQLVPGRASPDDPALAEYWAKRRQRQPPPPLDGVTLRQLRMQRGRCPCCGQLLLYADNEPRSPQEWELWLVVARKAVRRQAITVDRVPGTTDDQTVNRLIHAHCHGRKAAGRHPAATAAR